MDRPVPVRRPLARNGAPFRPRPEAADLRADRRDCRGAHVQPAGGNWRRAQLGLPLRLDPGCGIHGLRLPAPRLVRRSRTVHALSGFSLQRARSRRVAADHVWNRRAEASGRGDARSPRRLRGIKTGTHRQRRIQSVATRYLRRTSRRRLSLQQARGADLIRPVDLSESPDRLGLRQLASQGEGVWEVRGGQREFVYSKLMCWVALDRAIRLADKRSFPAPRDRWLKIRHEIYEDIVSKGWNEKRQAFVQHYGSESLDAANLMMALTFFMAPTDPRMLATLDATLLPLEKGGLTANSLVYRYNIKEAGDGLSGEEGTFNICTFWLVEALTRA